MAEHTHYISHWIVCRGILKERGLYANDRKWEKISGKFTVRSAAEQFATLARTQFPHDDIEARAIYITETTNG